MWTTNKKLIVDLAKEDTTNSEDLILEDIGKN